MGPAAPRRSATRDGIDVISLEEMVTRVAGLDSRELARWVENRWVLPERRENTWIFHDVDVARVELIVEIRNEFAVEEDALGLVLSLLDQVYDLRRQLGRLCDALATQPREIQTAIERALATSSETARPRE
jgi:chaperone modulatory protein CbpM